MFKLQFRFSLKALVAATIVMGPLCGWGWRSVVVPRNDQLRAIGHFKRINVAIYFGEPHELSVSDPVSHNRWRYSSLPASSRIPPWMSSFVNTDWAGECPVGFDFEMATRSVTDEDIEILTSLPDIEHLYLFRIASPSRSSPGDASNGCPKLTDRGISYLVRMPNLRRLYAAQCQITDDGAFHLAKIPQLEILVLSGSNITDNGMLALGGIPNLKALSLRRTRVTSAGVKEFLRRRPDVFLYVSKEVHPAGIAITKSLEPSLSVHYGESIHQVLPLSVGDKSTNPIELRTFDRDEDAARFIDGLHDLTDSDCRIDFESRPDGTKTSKGDSINDVYVAKGITFDGSGGSEIGIAIYDVKYAAVVADETRPGVRCAAGLDPLFQSPITIKFCKPGDQSLPATVRSFGCTIAYVIPNGVTINAYALDGMIIETQTTDAEGSDSITITSGTPIARVEILPTIADPDFAIDDVFFTDLKPAEQRTR